jgi:hypothetical protein
MDKKEAAYMRWVLVFGIPVGLFVAFYLGLWYGLDVSASRFEEYRALEQQTTNTLLLSIFKNTQQSQAE